MSAANDDTYYYYQMLSDRRGYVGVHMSLDLAPDGGGQPLDLTSVQLPPQVSLKGDDFAPVRDWRCVSVSYSSSTSVNDLIFTPDQTELTDHDDGGDTSGLTFNSPNATYSFTALADGDQEGWLQGDSTRLVVRFPLEEKTYDYVGLLLIINRLGNRSRTLPALIAHFFERLTLTTSQKYERLTGTLTISHK